MREVIADYRTQIRVKRIESIHSGWQLELEDGLVLQTRLLIGADGPNSFVRNQAMIDLDVLDYRQAAISCAVKTAQPHQHVARQLFCRPDHWHSCRWPVSSQMKRDFGSQSCGHCQKIMPRNMLH